jgi:GcrA cell cycle regulator
MSWTDERVETLKRMWNEGQSASQIAKELGGVTRNAVIGKVHRLGLSNRTGGAPVKPAAETEDRVEAKPTQSAPEPAPAEPKDVAPQAPIPMRKPIIPAGQPLPPQPSANEREVEKSAKRISLMELTERTCKWPIGDPATEDFWFCGLAAQPGKPYCEAHVGVAFQPMSSRRDRRR